MALNIRIDRTAGTFDVVSEDRVYVRDGGIAVKVYGFEESELSGNTTLAPCVQFVGRNGVMAQAELSLDSDSEEDETVAKGTLSTNTEQMASLFAGCVADTCRTVTVRVFATKVQKPIALGTVEVWNFPNGGTVPDNLITGAQLQTRINAALAAADSAEDDADDAEGYAKAAQEYASGKYVDGVLSVDGAKQFKEQAAESASSAQSSAAQANEYANGKTVNGVETKGAKQYANDAAASATNLAQAVTDAQAAKTAAQAARDKADEYANGKTVGGTVTQKGAQQYAEDAASSATDASTVLASAVKTTEQTLSDGEKTQARTNIGAQETLPLMDDGQTYGINVRGANEALTSSKAMIALKDEDGHFIKTTYANKSNLTSHTGNGGIHVTADQKAAWSAKQDAIAAFLKDASVSNKTLTLTKKDGTTVQFQGGSSAWADITGKPQSFTPSAHQHTKSQITDFPQSMDPNAHASAHATGGSDAITPASIGAQSILAEDGSDLPGGPYLQKTGGNVSSGGSSSATVKLIGGTGEYYSGGDLELSSGSEGNEASIKVRGGVYTGGSIEVFGPNEETFPNSTPASIKKGGKEVATEDQLPYSSTSAPADRTCATVTVASTGASVTIPKPSTANKVTAFCIYLDMTALTGTAPTVGFKYSDNTDAGILTRGGEGLSYETGAVNAVFFIQFGTKYIASAQVYKEASNG